MRKSIHSESEMVKAVKELESGVSAEVVAREYGISKATLYQWKSKYSGMDVSQVRRLKELEEEYNSLRCQIGTLKSGRGQHAKYLPYVFTEEGVAMLSGVLRSKTAIQVNINIMRAFVLIRQTVAAWQSTNFIPNNLDHVLDIRNKYNHEMTHYES